MATYRGNRGNFLQHWVLVELLARLRQQGLATLSFIDAYSMSPRATRSPKAVTDQTAPEFDRVLAHLAEGKSPYERAWLALNQSLKSDYPSSAAFVRHCWAAHLHLLLCEADGATAEEISIWLSSLNPKVTSFELHRGDWRERFQRVVPNMSDAYYISFDPNMYDRHEVRAPRAENMYPADIPVVGAFINGLPQVPIVLQLSTYGVNSANSQADVLDSVVPQFVDLGFAATFVRADNAMMSMIFTRDVSVESDFERRFQSWLASRRRNSGAA